MRLVNGDWCITIQFVSEGHSIQWSFSGKCQYIHEPNGMFFVCTGNTSGHIEQQHHDSCLLPVLICIIINAQYLY